ncbi:hypothetical protein HDU83_007120 [Entophlyctis luteolus]|nr:hypothetical protein HDU83_007120 [Entophlyctis luteolus]
MNGEILHHDVICGETYFGFVEDDLDAILLVEASIANELPLFSGNSVAMAMLRVRSGTVVVLPEGSRFLKRWMDGLHWSPSRAHGPFLLYRQTESVESRSSPGSDDCLKKIAGINPTFAPTSLKCGQRIAPGKSNPQRLYVIMNALFRKAGLTKKSITVRGSDGRLYRVISYCAPSDVIKPFSRRDDASETTLLKPSRDPRLFHVMETKCFEEALRLHRSKPRKARNADRTTSL